MENFMYNEAYECMVREDKKNKAAQAKVATETLMLLMQDMRLIRSSARLSSQTKNMIKFAVILIAAVMLTYVMTKASVTADKQTKQVLAMQKEAMEDTMQNLCTSAMPYAYPINPTSQDFNTQDASASMQGGVKLILEQTPDGYFMLYPAE